MVGGPNVRRRPLAPALPWICTSELDELHDPSAVSALLLRRRVGSALGLGDGQGRLALVIAAHLPARLDELRSSWRLMAASSSTRRVSARRTSRLTRGKIIGNAVVIRRTAPCARSGGALN